MSERFFPDVERGKTGEMVALWFFSQNPRCKSIINCQGDSYYQDIDIDFLVQVGDKVESIEVKTDYAMHRTGNLFYELTTSGHTGCFEKTRADTILVYSPGLNKLYQMKTAKLRSFVLNSKSSLKKSNGGDASEGYLIPVEWLIKFNVAKEVEL